MLTVSSLLTNNPLSSLFKTVEVEPISYGSLLNTIGSYCSQLYIELFQVKFSSISTIQKAMVSVVDYTGIARGLVSKVTKLPVDRLLHPKIASQGDSLGYYKT